jgi:hypothetical protein
MGARLKHPDQLQNKRGGRYRPLRAVEVGSQLTPALVGDFRDEVKEAWATLWGSDLGRSFKATDVIGLLRWAWYLNEWANAVSLPGDRRYVFKLEKALRELERFYGVDPLSRLRLGLTLVDNARAIDGLKAPIEPEERTG